MTRAAQAADAGPSTAPPPAAAAPEPSTPPSGPAELLARAESALASARPRLALEELEPLRLAAEVAPPQTARAAALRAMALQALGRGEEAQDAARSALASQRGDEATAAAATLVLARAAARQGRIPEAIRLYRRLAAGGVLVPGLPARQQRELAEDASFLAAWLPYDAGQYREAARSLRAWARTHRGARRADDARWFAAWSLVRAGARQEGRAALARLVPGRDQDAALYWMARLSADPAAQRRLYRRARAASGPDGWYGQLAAARLLALGERPAPWRLPPGAPPPDGPGKGAAGRSLARAAALLGAARPASARAEMASLAASRHARAAAARLAQLASLAGDAVLALQVARDHLPVSRRTLRYTHPDPWGPGLPAAAAGVDRHQLLALVRRESGFRPRSRSAAGAEGLVQLLPATAERLSTLAGIPGPPADLADPESSLALGAIYLGLLQDRLGHPAAALAAYNAGPGPAAGWARDLAGLPLDTWVENLPFRETRRYVKGVLADAQVYRWLEGGEPPAIDGLSTVPTPGDGVAF